MVVEIEVLIYTHCPHQHQTSSHSATNEILTSTRFIVWSLEMLLWFLITLSREEHQDEERTWKVDGRTNESGTFTLKPILAA